MKFVTTPLLILAFLFIAALAPSANAATGAKLFVVTGTYGTVCTGLKMPGPPVTTAGNCKSADGTTTLTMPRIASIGTTEVEYALWSYGAEIVCLVAVNYTTAAVLPSAILPAGIPPSGGVGWSCVAKGITTYGAL